MSTVRDKSIATVDGFAKRKIRHLNDEEMSDGWRLVLPNYILRTRKDSDNNKNTIDMKFTINMHLGQSYHLMFKVKEVYNDDKLVGYYVRDKIYEYRISLSEVDKDILNLAKVLHHPCPNVRRVKDLVKIIQLKELRRWVLLKANKFFEIEREIKFVVYFIKIEIILI